MMELVSKIGHGGVWLLSMITGIRPGLVPIRMGEERNYKRGHGSGTIRVKAEEPILLLLFCFDVSKEII